MSTKNLFHKAGKQIEKEKSQLTGEPLWSIMEGIGSSPWSVFLLDDELESSVETVDIKHLKTLDDKLKQLAKELHFNYYAFGLPMNDPPTQIGPQPNDKGWKCFTNFAEKIDSKKTVCVTDLLLGKEIAWGTIVLTFLKKRNMNPKNGCVFTKNMMAAEVLGSGYKAFDKNQEASIEGVLEFVRNCIGKPEWKTNLLKDLVTVRKDINLQWGHKIPKDYTFASTSLIPDGVDKTEFSWNLFYQEAKSSLLPTLPESGHAFYYFAHPRGLSSEYFVEFLNRALAESTLLNVKVIDKIKCKMLLPCQPGAVFVVRFMEFLESLHEFSDKELILERLNEGKVVALRIPLEEPQQLIGKLLCRPDNCCGHTVSRSLPNLLTCRLFDDEELSASNVVDANRASCSLEEINRVAVKFSKREGNWLAPLVGIDVYDKGIRLLWRGIIDGTEATF